MKPPINTLYTSYIYNTVKVVPSASNKHIMVGFGSVTVASLLAAVVLESPLPAALPLGLLLVYWTVLDFRRIYFLLLACLPFSIEYQLPNGFGTDLPTEPLTVGLMLVFILVAFQKGLILRGGAFLRHPITLLLLAHVAWMAVALVYSQDKAISIKFFLAKIWYIVTFYALSGYLLRRREDLQTLGWTVFLPLIVAVCITLVRHAGYGFSFKDVNYVMQPMFRNHVSYACIISLFLPYVVLLWLWSDPGSRRRMALLVAILVLLVAVQLSFTRAAYGALIGAAGYCFIVKYRLTKVVLALAVIGFALFSVYIYQNNKYLDYAPRYDKAISHQNFDNLLEATAKGEDISTMERVYRWVAGVQMVAAKPWTGFGPNTFNTFYQSFTVNKFRTYVSDNPEQSTVHCYYLLVAIEQGLPGAFLFLLLVAVALWQGEILYHRAVLLWQKQAILAVLASFVCILILIIINDLIETDKVGSFFFINLALLTNLSRAIKDPLSTEAVG